VIMYCPLYYCYFVVICYILRIITLFNEYCIQTSMHAEMVSMVLGKEMGRYPTTY